MTRSVMLNKVKHLEILHPARAGFRMTSLARRTGRGQAFAEFIIALIVLPLFITGTITIARMFMVNMRLHQAARHGAFLMATRRVTWTNARADVMNYFTRGYPKFNTSNIIITHRNVRVGNIAGDEVTVTYRLKIFMLIEFNPKNNELLTTRWNKRNKQVF